jgi:hypothetical protein
VKGRTDGCTRLTRFCARLASWSRPLIHSTSTGLSSLEDSVRGETFPFQWSSQFAPERIATSAVFRSRGLESSPMKPFEGRYLCPRSRSPQGQTKGKDEKLIEHDRVYHLTSRRVRLVAEDPLPVNLTARSRRPRPLTSPSSATPTTGWYRRAAPAQSSADPGPRPLLRAFVS